MIRTLGEMLETLRRAEARRLDEMDIKHAPTIGEMYESLTQDVLDRAIPPGLDLNVVSGFAIDGNGGTTGQIDCMLVHGEGIPVPYTPVVLLTLSAPDFPHTTYSALTDLFPRHD